MVDITKSKKVIVLGAAPASINKHIAVAMAMTITAAIRANGTTGVNSNYEINNPYFIHPAIKKSKSKKKGNKYKPPKFG